MNFFTNFRTRWDQFCRGFDQFWEDLLDTLDQNYPSDV